MKWVASIKSGIGKAKIAIALMDDGFERIKEPCPHCGNKKMRYRRGVEHICLACTYGALWPDTREKHGFGEPYGPSYMKPSNWQQPPTTSTTKLLEERSHP